MIFPFTQEEKYWMLKKLNSYEKTSKIISEWKDKAVG